MSNNTPIGHTALCSSHINAHAPCDCGYEGSRLTAQIAAVPASEPTAYERVIDKAKACGARVTQHEIGFTHGEFGRFIAALSPPTAPAQPKAPGMGDAYAGAREDLAAWKTRALEAEALNRKFAASVNGLSFMGEPAAPTQAGEYPADTGNPKADRIIGRLASSDPDFDDCAAAVALIHKLVAEHKGPVGFATWKDAAVAARLAAQAAPAGEVASERGDWRISVSHLILHLHQWQAAPAGGQSTQAWDRLQTTINALAAPAPEPAAPGYVSDEANEMRLTLLNQFHAMADIAENYARHMHKRGDTDERDAIEGAIKFAREKVAPHNYNGPYRAAPQATVQPSAQEQHHDSPAQGARP